MTNARRRLKSPKPVSASAAVAATNVSPANPADQLDHDCWPDHGLIALAATPLGNDLDASMRLKMWLAHADLIAAEDTRRVHGLARRLGISMRGQVVSNYEANETARASWLVERAKQGARVLVVSDAGMPVVSDPGFVVARLAASQNVQLTCLPGPSAVLAALAVSGLPADRFCFEGFWPRRGQTTRLTELAGERRTMIFFVPARRLAVTLAAMAEAWGVDRPAVVARELTKTHEAVQRGSLSELADWASETAVLGEVTLVVAGVGRRVATSQ
ncbi:MAG: rRNA small subunit methyltransferase 1 [Bifidobacteriaceae bacterium]|jgi:16S rRNA (cytidine1402-2'-O)-methyltransferase|nr:rRNA small subunit methyltransferase 1 [Bifidobacteriaceae bacterium]